MAFITNYIFYKCQALTNSIKVKLKLPACRKCTIQINLGSLLSLIALYKPIWNMEYWNKLQYVSDDTKRNLYPRKYDNPYESISLIQIFWRDLGTCYLYIMIRFNYALFTYRPKHLSTHIYRQHIKYGKRKFYREIKPHWFLRVNQSMVELLLITIFLSDQVS